MRQEAFQPLPWRRKIAKYSMSVLTLSGFFALSLRYMTYSVQWAMSRSELYYLWAKVKSLR